MSEFVKVGPIKNFPVNQTTGIQIGELEVAIANTNGELTAFDNCCTHAQSLLTPCDIEDGQVDCPLHGARFDVKTGMAMTLPATRPVRMHELKIQDNMVFVKLNDQPAETHE